MSTCLEQTKVNSLEQLREKRWKWVEASRDNNFEGGIKQLLTDLYPDNAHFIYELLQNAEDACATAVRFVLGDSVVEFEHNGKKLFSLQDICSITSIGASNKRDDPTNIGKFGVGFKAVFAYTNTPEIHSGEFHFRIHDLVVPETDDVSHTQTSESNTRFYFPFDNPKKPTQQAALEIKRALRALGDNTLLFLNNIRKIEYQFPDGALGSLERAHLGSERIGIRTTQPGGGEETVSHWLRFEKDVEITDEDDKSKTCRIAIAYQLANEDDRKGGRAWKIVPVDHGQVSIYFPAEKEASSLRFHIHAPFASTVARDSVRDCEANNKLRNHLARLIAESIASIRDQGLLTVGFLAVLPNLEDKLSPFYEPILHRIIEEFTQNQLVPIRAGGHAAARNLIRCPAKLVKELSDDDLFIISGKPIRVAANPQQLNQREDKFLKSLGISDWGWRELNIALSSLDQRPAIETWMGKKDDEGLQQWYSLLNDSRNQVDNLDIGNLCLVRARSVYGPAMLRPGQAFFPQEASTTRPDDVCFVETAFCSGDSRALLESIGVRPYDEKASIGLILERYKSLSEPGADHVSHVRRFVEFWKRNQHEAKMFASSSFLLGTTPKKGDVLCQPSKLYLDKPYADTLLSTYYEKLPNEKRTYYPLSSIYGDNGISLEDLAQFSKAAGVISALAVVPMGSVNRNPDKDKLQLGCIKKDNNNAYGRHEVDFDIREFKVLLEFRQVSASKLIWKTMNEFVEEKHLHATYRHNNKSAETHCSSQLVHQLRNTNWVPQGDGRFVKPSQAIISELPAGFPVDARKEWLRNIGFGDEERKRSEEYQARDQMARDMGLRSVDDLDAYVDAIKESGLTPEQIRAAGTRRRQIPQPQESVKDTEKRRRGVKEGGDSAPTKESVVVERAIQPDIPAVTAGAKAYLRAKYRNSAEQLVCQCCHDEMPFKLRTGEHYFEAIQCVRNQHAHYYQNRLALCPTCAAMYQHARETDDAEIWRRIVEHPAADQAPAVEISLRLAGRDHSLHFVGTHWFDLKTVLSTRED
jgi:hypothetical protein